MNLPIIFVFRGWQPYFQLSVDQARRWNPNSTIYHISTSGKKFAEGAVAVDEEPYQNLASEFSSVYQHLSSNTVGFELFCFQRWMISYEFMLANGMEQAVLMDGDILLWADLSQIFPLFEAFSMTWTEPQQPGTVFIQDRSALRLLCEYMIEQYKSPEAFARLKEEYAKVEAAGGGGGVTDMSMLRYFRQEGKCTLGDNGQIVEGGRFDHQMMTSDGFETLGGFKKFYWEGGIPYAADANTQEKVRFYSMHFMGPAKGYMPLFANEQNVTAANKLRAMPNFVRARLPSLKRKLLSYIK